jgi:hypothetical protein
MIAPARPNLSSPAAGAVVRSTIPTFYVGSVSGARYYQFQVGLDDTLSDPLVDVTRTTYSYTLLSAQALPFGTLFWRAQAIDAAGNPSGWSSPRMLIVNILKSPANASYTTSIKPTFSWDSASRALQYRLQVDDTADFSSILELDVTRPPSTSYLPISALPYSKYHWRMQVLTAAGWSNWTPASAFTVTPALPVAPIPALPSSGTITKLTTPTLSWSPVINGVKYEVQVSKVYTFTSTEQDVVLDPGVLNYTTTTLLDGRHYWRVRGINYLDVPGKWSGYKYFTINSLLP